MGQLLYQYKKSIVDNLVYTIQTGKDVYYAIGAKSIPNAVNTVPYVGLDVYESQLEIGHQLEFGKRISVTDIAPVIRNIRWTPNTIYSAYDDKDQNLFDKNFYVITDPDTSGADRHVFKCISNANNSPSFQKPDILQLNWFEKSDGYRWKYMFSISQQNYDKWATTYYIPVTQNTAITQSASLTTGLNSIIIESGGMNYLATHEGIIRSVVNSTLVQIETSASMDNDFYNKSSIYMYNSQNQTGQIKEISQYISNTTGKWCILSSSANTELISSGLTAYKISPTVKILGDCINPAYAYSVVSNNSISDIVIIDRGVGYSHAEIQITANTSYGIGAQARTIISPPGGHGAKPDAELGIKGLSFNIQFKDSEGYELPVMKTYSAIGIIRNPKMSSNSSLVLNVPSFSQILKGYVSGGVVFNENEKIIGQTSKALGYVFHSNSSVLWLTGDKGFKNGEKIVGQTSNLSSTIQVFDPGAVWAKDLDILYVNHINAVTRGPTQTETYKIIIEV